MWGLNFCVKCRNVAYEAEFYHWILSYCKCGHGLWTLLFLVAYAVLLLLNVIGSLMYFIASSQLPSTSNRSGMTFGLSLLFLILFTPCSFVCWYRPIYKAFRWATVVEWRQLYLSVLEMIVASWMWVLVSSSSFKKSQELLSTMEQLCNVEALPEIKSMCVLGDRMAYD